MDIIAKEKPDVLCIQETMLSKQTNFNLKNYNGLIKEGHTNIRAHGGVGIFIYETIPYQKLTLNTPLQTIAARINIGRDVTLTIVYIETSRNHDINENLLSTLFQQLPNPVILTGDFNSYNQIWGSPVNDNLGDKAGSFINKNQLNVLNDGRHTRTRSTSKSAVDLTTAFPSLQPILSWIGTGSPLCSNHCMITVNILSKTSEP